MGLVSVNIFIGDLNDGVERERVKFKERARLRGYRSSLEDGLEERMNMIHWEKSYQHDGTQIIKLRSSVRRIICNHTVTWQQERRWSFSAWQVEQEYKM